MKTILIELDKLKKHEAVNQNRVTKLKQQMLFDGYIKNPVIVEKEHLIILDGHHRVQALLELGAKYVPVQLVNYDSDQVRVYWRSPNSTKEIKQAVIKMSLSGRVFGEKTTRHFIRKRLRQVNINLKRLKLS